MTQLEDRAGFEGQLVALEAVVQTLREQETVKTLIETTLGCLKSEFDFDLIWIGLCDLAKPGLMGQGGITPGGDIPLLKQRLLLSPGDLLDQVLVQQSPVGVPDLREESRAGEWRKVAKKFNIQGGIIFPIQYKDHCSGLALVGSRLWGVFPRSGEMAKLSMILRALGSALHRIQLEVQRQSAKRSDQPLLALLAKLSALPTLNQCLEAVVQQTREFVEPARTSIYWFDPERGCFWRRTHQAKVNRREGQQSGLEIVVQEVNGFYQALSADQMIVVSEAQSSLKTEVTGRLMQQLKARSLLAAPILSQNELHGFLVVEGTEPRIWQEAEKNYLQGAARLVAVTAPLEKQEKMLRQTQRDQVLLSGLTRAIYSDNDWNKTLKQGADQLCERLQVERLLVLLVNQDGRFEVCYQHQGAQGRPLQKSLNPLSNVDWQMLERAPEAIAVENLSQDLKLMAWREALLALGVRSLLACSTSIGRPLEGLLVVCNQASRPWNSQERQVVQGFSQQLGLILHQWQLQRHHDQQQQIDQILQQGLATIQQTHELVSLEQATLQQVTQLLQVPLAAWVRWSPGQRQGWIVTPPMINRQFAVRTEIAVGVDDPLIQLALQATRQQTTSGKYPGLLLLNVDELDLKTRGWLNGSEIGQIGAIALQTEPEHEPSGVLLVADHREQRWSDLQLGALVTLVKQVAWAHRTIQLTTSLQHRNQDLECLNWYKQRRIEAVYRSVVRGSNKLNELMALSPIKVRAGSGTDPGQIPEGANPLENHYQPIMGQLQGALTSMLTLIQSEDWQPSTLHETMVLPTLLKQVLERVEP